MPCGIDDCQVTFTNFHAFKRHLRKKHRHHLSDMEAEDDDHYSDLETSDVSVVSDDITISDHDMEGDGLVEYCNSSSTSSNVSADWSTRADRERAVALWILKLKEGRKLTQSATEEILQDVTELCCDMISNLKSDIYKVLSSAGINGDDVSGLEDLFHDESPYMNPFSKLETQYLQKSYYKTYLGFVVSTYYS